MTFKFHHPYLKLERPSFTTIRGKSTSTQAGWMVICEHKAIQFKARVSSVERMILKNISLEVLQNDMQHDGYQGKVWTPHSKFQAMDFLNTFRVGNYPKLTMDSEVAVITLVKIIN